MLVSSALSFLAATLTLIAFAIDIALFGLVKSEMNDFTANATTTTAPGTSNVFQIIFSCHARNLQNMAFSSLHWTSIS